MNKRVELLAPAGSFDCLKTAIANGANACYLGGKTFSARAFANNFSEEELIEAVKYAHLRNVKIYVTLNTLLNEKQIANAMKMVDFYYRNNVDALLIQDLGLYYLIKEKYPDFEIHCSTQMHVHNLQGVRNAKKLGFKRVVIARESTLDFIKQACKEDIEIETFVHGALCVSYSGQCLMSSVTKNRSANKGMCAQCCRLKYEILDEDNNKIKTHTDYLLSPKDMCLIDDIPKLLSLGVSSLKIEGRMKSSAYVGYVTRIYRNAIDAYYNNEEFKLNDTILNNLKVLFNRDFSNDYLYDRNDLFKQIMPNHLGVEIGETIAYHNNKVKIKLTKELNQFDGIRIKDFGCIVNMLYKDGLLVNKANANDYVEIEVDHNVSGKVYKTIDYNLEKEVNSFKDIKLPINLFIKIKPNEKVFIKCNDFNYESQIVALQSQNKPLDYSSIHKQLSKLNDTIYYLDDLTVDSENAFLPVSKLNEIRREFVDKYNEYRLSLFKREVINSDITYIKNKEIEINELIQENNMINNYRINYVINKDSIYHKDSNVVISEFGGLLVNNEHKLANYTLNISNSYAYELLRKLGFEAIILSSELNIDEIDDLINEYKLRNHEVIKPFVLREGNRPLMYIKAKPFDEYIKDDSTYYLSDGTNKYRIRINNQISELLESNSKHLDVKNSQFRAFNIKS